MNYQHIGRSGRQSNRRKILQWVVRNFCIEAGIDDEARADNRDCIAVGRRSGARAHAEISARAWLILDIELLAKRP